MPVGLRLTRRELAALLTGTLLGGPNTARAQAPAPRRRVGILIGLPPTDEEVAKRSRAFREALAEFGWAEGRNLHFEERSAGDTAGLRSAASQLVQLRPDVILTHSTPATAAVQREAAGIPIVFVSIPDPVGSRFVDSLPRPAGNITGFTNFEPAIGGKWVELLRDLAPSTRRIGMIYNPETASGGATGGVYLRAAGEAAQAWGIQLVAGAVKDAAEIEAVLALLATEHDGAAIVMPSVFTGAHRGTIVRLAAKHRVPTTYPFAYFVRGGGLASYGVDLTDLFRRAAGYVNAILRGARPHELPVQGPTRFELALNLSTAKELGLVVQPALLALADEIVE
jgi:putative ABC transport system substrate-binding protein